MSIKALLLIALWAATHEHADAFVLPSMNSMKKASTSKRIEITASLSPAQVALAIAVPSSAGYIKREYGVSYGYGGSVAAAGYLALKAVPGFTNKLSGFSSSVGMFHALLHVLYGVRLCLFLGIRELTVPKFKEMKEKIEKNSPPQRIQRTGFILSCGLLYAWMSFPLFVSCRLPLGLFSEKFVDATLLGKAIWGSLYVAASGLALQIIGDTQKYISKARNPSKLVTSGVYSLFRHPNYTGEVLLWSGSTLTGLLCAFGTATHRLGKMDKIALSIGSVLGYVGIVFVLAMAATGLEKRQKESYGSTDEYKNWIKRTTPGPMLPPKKTT